MSRYVTETAAHYAAVNNTLIDLLIIRERKNRRKQEKRFLQKKVHVGERRDYGSRKVNGECGIASFNND